MVTPPDATHPAWRDDGMAAGCRPLRDGRNLYDRRPLSVHDGARDGRRRRRPRAIRAHAKAFSAVLRGVRMQF